MNGNAISKLIHEMNRRCPGQNSGESYNGHEKIREGGRTDTLRKGGFCKVIFEPTTSGSEPEYRYMKEIKVSLKSRSSSRQG